MLARSLRCGVLKLLVCGIFIVKFSRKRALVGIVLKPLRRGPLIILCKSLREDLVEILGVPA